MTRSNGVVACLAVAVVLCVSAVYAGTNPHFGQKTLVLLDTYDQKQAHSLFFADLKARGYEMTFLLADDPELVIEQYGEFQYDQLVLFCPEVEEFGGLVDGQVIVDFIDSGRSVIFAGATGLSEPMRELAAECGVTFDASNTAVIDHLAFDVSDFDGEHTLLVADSSAAAGAIVPKTTNVLWRGIGQSIDTADGLVVEVLSAGASAYSYSASDAVDSDPALVGSDAVLVSALQARNNARVLFSGSLDLFSNELYTSEVKVSGSDAKAAKSGNAAFVSALTEWTFQERGIIRARDVAHSMQSGEQSSAYRVKDDITYSITLEEWVGGKWVPYKADDVQLEFTMLDPYVRTTLKHDGKGRYSVDFTTPDVYGIFKFDIDYRRAGLSNVHSSTQVTVVPFRHTDYERFIPAAFPYYASAFSMMAGFFVVSVVFLHHRD